MKKKRQEAIQKNNTKSEDRLRTRHLNTYYALFRQKIIGP